MLIALPAAAQIAPRAGGTTPVVTSDGAPLTPAVTGDSTVMPPATPVLESPALGPLGGPDTPINRPFAGGALLGFANTAPGLGVAGVGTPFDLGNRPYAIRPSIGVEVLATDNVFQTSVARGDIVSTIAPSLEAAIATTRLNGTLRYTPALRLYGTYSSQDGVDQVGDGRLLAALVPGLFYVDVRGAASVLPTFPGFIPGSGQLIAGSDTMQTYTAQVTPFLVHRFGSAATVQAGYSFQYSSQNFANFGQSSPFSQSSPDSLAENWTAHRGFAVVRSGEDFGRLALQACVDGTKYAGNGIYDDSHRFITALETRYAILRSVALLGEIGYENQEYSGTNPFSISDAIWSIGLRLTPRPDSIVVIRYGRQNGFNSFSLNAGTPLGVRTDLFATYRETLATSLTQAQDLLSTTTVDALGNPVDSQSGAPVVLINPFLGLSDALYRMRVGTASLRHHWPRDVLTLSGTWQSQDPITSANSSVFVVTSRGTYATLSWGHEFSPRTTGLAAVQYGHASFGQPSFGQPGFGQPGQGDSDIYALTETLMHQLSDKLTGSIQVAWTNNTSPLADQGYTQAILRVGLRRTF
ncbi:MAG TPA: TIGR03016 family PEP-CTERM system-associated outer membrane protein [Variovorax sp.]